MTSVEVKAQSTTTGVELVEAEAGAEYYSLDGVKVANPANGYYIKVSEGKAVKVLVK